MYYRTAFILFSSLRIGKNPLDVKFREECQLTDDNIFIGSQTRDLLDQMNDKSRKNFFLNVRSFYKRSVSYIKDKLPLSDNLLCHAEVADVALRYSAKYSDLNFFRKKFPILIPKGGCIKTSLE